MTQLKQLTTEFEVRDALGGEITGDYHWDIKILNDAGYDCTWDLYQEAYQMTEQP